MEKINVRWHKGASEEDKAIIKAELKSSNYILKRLKKIISEEVETIRRKARLPETLQNPNWANAQAFYLGVETGLNIIDNLLTKEENND